VILLGRGRRWSIEENSIIIKMYGGGCSVSDIAEKLPVHRSFFAVKQQVFRLGLRRGGIVATMEKNIVPTIVAEEAMSREDALNILSAAIRQLQRGGELTGLEVRRLRSIATMVRSYFAVYDSYERYAELEARMNELEAFVRTEAENLISHKLHSSNKNS
jgi:hypothetical protein